MDYVGNRVVDYLGNMVVDYVGNRVVDYFVEAPLAVITAFILLGYDATSLARLYLGSFSHSSLQILSGLQRC